MDNSTFVEGTAQREKTKQNSFRSPKSSNGDIHEIHVFMPANTVMC